MKKAAIEFSANVIVIVVISTIILSLGLIMFFNIKGNAEKYTEAISDQTKQELKALMLNDNSKISVYPNDLTIPAGKSEMTTVAVMNTFDTQQSFSSQKVTDWSVLYYSSPESSPDQLKGTNNNNNWWKNSESIIINTVGSNTYWSLSNINPGEQIFKNILIKIPKTAKKGEYVISVNITKDLDQGQGSCAPSCPTYALTKIYVTVP